VRPFIQSGKAKRVKTTKAKRNEKIEKQSSRIARSVWAVATGLISPLLLFLLFFGLVLVLDIASAGSLARSLDEALLL